jgi:hypothetical protein
MPIINKVSGVTLRRPGVQGSQQQYTYIPMLPKQGLRQDTISFSRFWGKKTPRNEYFSPEAYRAVSEYLERNDSGQVAQSGAYCFMKEIKRYAEDRNHTDIGENVQSFVDYVEPLKIPEVIDLLTKIVETLPMTGERNVISCEVEDYKQQLEARLKKINQS